MLNRNRLPTVMGKAAMIGIRHPDYSRKFDVSAIAIAFNLKQHGKAWLGNCPACGYANAFSLREQDGQPLWYCHACQDSDAIGQVLRGREVDDRHRLPCLKNRKKPDPDKLAYIRQLWQQGESVAGSLAERYLTSRGLVSPYPVSLRFLPACKHTPTGIHYPALLAAVVCWPSREPVAIHRTYLKPDGSGKIDHPQARMMLGTASGGAVRLAPCGGRLGIAEGIETALSVQQATHLPMWACLSTSGLQNVILPDTVRDVTIAADHDPPGQRAAQMAAERLIGLGKRVRIALPPQAGTDFNDIIQGGHHE